MTIKLLKFGLLAAIAIAFFPIQHHLVILAIISFLLLMLIGFGLYRQEFAVRDLLSPYFFLMSAIFLWSVISRLWVRDAQAWLIAIGIIFIAWALLLGLKITSRDSIFRGQLAWWLAFLLMVHQITGWYYVFERQLHLQISQVFQFNLTLGNPNLFFRNINDYALMMFFAVFWTLVMPVDFIKNEIGRNLARGLKLLFILSSLAQVFFAGSRGIFVATILALLFYAFLHIKRKNLRYDILFASGIVAAVALMAVWEDILAFLSGDASAVIRFNLVRNDWEHLKLTNFLGVGAGNVATFQGLYPFHWTGNLTLMHNWFMGLITANGLIMGAIYILFYLWTYIKSYRLSVDQRKPLARFVTAWLAAFVIAGMIPDSLFTYIWFWLIHHLVFLAYEWEAEGLQKQTKH